MMFSKLISSFSAVLVMVAVSTIAIAQPVNDICSSAIDLQPLLPAGQEPVLLGPYSNEFATGNDLDIATVTGCWFDDLMEAHRKLMLLFGFDLKDTMENSCCMCNRAILI
jgi:hypothetical protein